MNKKFFSYIYFLLVVALNTTAFSQKKFISGKDLFGTRVFIENKGQFNAVIPNGERVRFAYETADENIYFTPEGPVYKLIKRYPMGEEEMEKMERGRKIKPKPDKVYFVNVNWLNANPNIDIIESEKQEHYFTYGKPELNSHTFKKITYKNVYNNIDIEYTMPDNLEHGLKYNIILHPGANPSDIKIAYTGEVRKIVLRNGKVIVKTPLKSIVEHPPISYYENKEELVSQFSLENNVVSFKFPNGIDLNRKVILDPWVTTITTLLPANYGLDVDYDFGGNLFVYGGLNQIKVAKYDPLGNLLWTFSGVVIGLPWTTQGVGNNYIGNFLVNKIDGKTYIGQGYEPASGASLIRLDPAGNYDNFVTPILFTVEVWDMAFHCPTNKVYELGGATITNLSGGIINQITGSVTTGNFTGIPTSGQDILSCAIDDQGVLFAILSSNGTIAVHNKMIRINNTFNGNDWFQPSTYNSFTEAANKGGYVGGIFLSNGYNCLAVNSNYLYYYDGTNIAAYDKNTGIKLGFTTIPYGPLQQGGIAVDECDNVYVGGVDNIISFNFNGLTFTPLPSLPLTAPSPNKYVYDIKLDRNSKKLYVSGSGFAGVYSAANSLTCGVVSPFALTGSCFGFNNGTAVATLTMGIANPTINYVWVNGGGTVAATMSTSATSNTVNLPNGTYTLYTQVNAPCGPSYINTVNIVCCQNITLTPLVTQAGCANPVNSATVNISGGGTVVPTVTWTPPPGAVGPGSLTASNLPVGITTVLVNHGAGCITTTTVNVLPPAPPVTFTINNLTGSYSITCTNPTINLQAVSNYTYGTISYSWTSPSFTANTTTVAISAANTLTLTGIDLATGCLFQQTVAIGINTAVPSTSVFPTAQAVTCSSVSLVTFTGTAISPTINVQHDWYSPLNPLPAGVPIVTSNNSISVLNGNLPPGIYTLQTTNLVNGCKTIKTVTINSLDAWPTFSINSTTGFSIGCAPLNQTTLSITNPVSTQTPPATCSYTFLAPSFTGAVTQSIVLGGNTSTVTQIPGTWTVIVQDNSNFCRTQLAIPILQNTVAPNVSATMLTQTLTCKNPTVIGTGTSTTANTIINWGVPSTPPLLSTSTLVIGPPNGPNTSTTSLSYATYTVIATNTLNACQSTSIITINQNFKPPISSPTISIGTPTAIYCTVASNPVVLTTGNSTTTSGGVNPPAFVVNPTWFGPSPQASITGVSSYSCYVPGIYSLTVEDNYNGCTRTGTINVIDRTQPPVIINPNATATLDCGASQAQLVTAVSATNAGVLMYWYVQYPVGASFSPSNAIIANGGNPDLSGTTSSTVNVSMSGSYFYIVTNTLTGCHASGAFNVMRGDLVADFTPDHMQGYAPLIVNYTNNSFSSNGSNGITSVWSFGNGTSQTTTTNINTTAIYSSPGTFSVLLIASKGSCLDSTYKVIKVDLPSKMEVPNVFTPNGDGSNDVFFMKVANLQEITAIIFDRWGNKVYEVNSSTGNIAWDGKNLQGKECASGVYFYVIKSKGKDEKAYEEKGNVSLFR